MTARVTIGRQRELRANGKRVPLTFQENEILWTLMTKPAVKRDELVDILWPCASVQPDGALRTIDTLICKLRRKLQSVGWTIRLIGYGNGWVLGVR